ncbi:MAG: DUF3108 domain-containing protein [Elusimicrobiota bacterium]|jgi:hypothetical protein
MIASVLPLFLAFAASLSAQEASTEAFRSPMERVRGALSVSSAIAKVPWFPESLEFDIKWGIMAVGAADMKMGELLDYDGGPAYRIVSTARSNGFCDTFYKVRDVNESWVAADDLRSLGYSKKLREGGFFRDEWVAFDYARKMFFSRRFDKDGRAAESSGPIPGPVQDMLSSIYYLRPRALKVGDEIVLDVNTKSNWPLVVKVLRREKVRVPAGTFETLVVEPGVRQEGIFVQKGKRLQVWLTDDERHTPVQMKVEVFFGHVSAYLRKLGG